MESNNRAIIKYTPNEGLMIFDIEIGWGVDRNSARRILNEVFEEQNTFIDMSEYHKGSSDFNLYQFRDIYQSIKNRECLIFFNYDKNNLLNEVEIRKVIDIDIFIGNILLSFDKKITMHYCLIFYFC